MVADAIGLRRPVAAVAETGTGVVTHLPPLRPQRADTAGVLALSQLDPGGLSRCLTRAPGGSVTPDHCVTAIIDKPGTDREGITQRGAACRRGGRDGHRGGIAFLGKAYLTRAIHCGP